MHNLPWKVSDILITRFFFFSGWEGYIWVLFWFSSLRLQSWGLSPGLCAAQLIQMGLPQPSSRDIACVVQGNNPNNQPSQTGCHLVYGKDVWFIDTAVTKVRTLVPTLTEMEDNQVFNSKA